MNEETDVPVLGPDSGRIYREIWKGMTKSKLKYRQVVGLTLVTLPFPGDTWVVRNRVDGMSRSVMVTANCSTRGGFLSFLTRGRI